jgi:hypothetical protein
MDKQLIMKSKERIMKTNYLLITLILIAALPLAGCGSRARVGALRSESQAINLGDVKSVRVEIKFGAGDLDLTGGAEKLMEADFSYNVAELKPEVEYKNGTLFVRQPDGKVLSDLRDINDYRNQWNLRLNDEVPMDLVVDVGAGSSNLQLAGLSLTSLDINLGASVSSVIDLSGNWVRDLDATIETGAANITVRVPSDVGVRVKVEAGLGTIEAPGLTKDGNVYTNAAYGVSNVTLQIDMEVGIGQINLEVEDAAAMQDYSSVTGNLSQLY